MVGRHPHRSVAPPFFVAYSGSGEVIQRLARSQRTPKRAKKSSPDGLARDPLFLVRPSSKLTKAAISKVRRLLCSPNLRGFW
jgi:hypothetical protein